MRDTLIRATVLTGIALLYAFLALVLATMGLMFFLAFRELLRLL